MTDKDKIDLINDVAEFIYEETVTFEYDGVGSTAAYLFWAIAADTSIDVTDIERSTVNMLRSNKELWNRVKEFIIEE